MERVVSGFAQGDVVATLYTLRAVKPDGKPIPVGTTGRVIDSDGFMVGVAFGKRVVYTRASWLWLVETARA